MFQRLSLVVAALFAAGVAAAATLSEPEPEPEVPLQQWEAERSRIFEANDIDLMDFLWQARPVVVFADTPVDPNFQRQIKLLSERVDELVERDVLIVTDTDPANPSPLREKLRPRGFMLVLIGKDGGVKLRKPFPWDVREISRSIDKTPLRQQEIRDRRNLNQ